MAIVRYILDLNNNCPVIDIVLDRISNARGDLLLEANDSSGGLPVVVGGSLADSNISVIGAVLD